MASRRSAVHTALAVRFLWNMLHVTWCGHIETTLIIATAMGSDSYLQQPDTRSVSGSAKACTETTNRVYTCNMHRKIKHPILPPACTHGFEDDWYTHVYCVLVEGDHLRIICRLAGCLW